MITALFITTYLLLDPANWLSDFMELTYMSFSYKMFILILAVASFAISYFSEMLIFPRLAALIGKAREKLSKGNRKKRKEYKLVLESMRM